MVSDYTIARYLNNLGNESHLGDWDADLNAADLNKTDSNTDALNPENAAFDASEARARYLGLGGTSSREMFAAFSNQLNVLLGRPAQNYGQNGLFGQPGMQYPGMQNALAAPVQGVNVYVGAPVFGQAIVTGGGEITGASSAPAGGGGVNVTANIGGGEATGVEKLDEAVKAAQEKAPEGYEPSEWKRIVDDAKAAAEKRAKANDTDADDEFRDILNKLPSKDLKEQVDENGVVVGATADQKKADYGRKLGEWYAEEIEGIDGTPERARIVDDVAGQDKEGFKLERASGKKLPKNVKAYTVSGDASQHGLSNGQKIFWVEDPKSEQGGWFKEASRKGVNGRIEGLGVKGGDQEIEVGGRSDWIELEQDKDLVVEDKAAEDTKHASLYDNFKIKDSSGETADAINADNDNVYRGNDGKWYVKQDDKFVEIMPVQPKLVAGRLYFNDAKVPVDPSRVDDLPAYMDDISKAAADMRVRKAAMDEGDSKSVSERVTGVAAALDNAMDEAGRKKLVFVIDGTGKRIDIACDTADCKTVRDAMGFDPVEADQQRQINAILKDLPQGVDVYLNGKKLSLSEDRPLGQLQQALGKAAPAATAETVAADSAAADALKDRVTLKSGKPIDFSGKNVDDDYIVDELAKRVESAQKKSKTDKVSEIVIEDKAIFPKSFSTTKGGGGDEVLDAAHVRNIAYMLSEKFGYIPVSFSNATRKGDPKGSSFTTGLTKSQVEQEKRRTEKNMESAAASAAAPKPQSSTASVDPKPADKPDASVPPAPVPEAKPPAPPAATAVSSTATAAHETKHDKEAKPPVAPAPATPASAPASAPAAASGWASFGDDGTGKSPAPAVQAKPETQGEKILREAQERAAAASAPTTAAAPKPETAKQAMEAYKENYSKRFVSYGARFKAEKDPVKQEQIRSEFYALLNEATTELNRISDLYGKKGDVQKFLSRETDRINMGSTEAPKWVLNKPAAAPKASEPAVAAKSDKADASKPAAPKPAVPAAPTGQVAQAKSRPAAIPSAEEVYPSVTAMKEAGLKGDVDANPFTISTQDQDRKLLLKPAYELPSGDKKMRKTLANMGYVFASSDGKTYAYERSSISAKDAELSREDRNLRGQIWRFFTNS